jgi:hypothetical protein
MLSVLSLALGASGLGSRAIQRPYAPTRSSPANAALRTPSLPLVPPRSGLAMASGEDAHSVRPFLDGGEGRSPFVIEDPAIRAELEAAGLLTLARAGIDVSRLPCKGNAATCLSARDGSCELIARIERARGVRVAVYLALWYALSLGYQIANKRVSNVLDLPCTLAAATTSVGAVLVGAAWATGVRRRPRGLSAHTWRTLVVLGVLHGLGQLAGTVGTWAGSVSFA